MKCIIAQGNPGIEYSVTRHNIGFGCLDGYAKQLDTEFTDKSKFHAHIAGSTVGNEKIILVKPTTFYNQTGRSVRAIKDFYKLDISDILVVHDDLALEFGKVRIRHRGSDAGNNGIRSINSTIGEDYARLRIGIYNKKRDVLHDSAFVLSRFSEIERENIKKQVFPICFQAIDTFINEDLVDESFSIQTT